MPKSNGGKFSQVKSEGRRKVHFSWGARPHERGTSLGHEEALDQFLPARPGADRSLQQEHDDVLDLADVTGKRRIDTRLEPKITICQATHLGTWKRWTKLCAADAEILLATPYCLVEVKNEESCADAGPR